MPQTFYIEADEEIISVIGRLRKSSTEENIFVFPKRALVLQSIVNLRLFQREAQKLGKKIVIVSQDEVGRMLAEKAGVETENYSEDFSRKETHLELMPEKDVPQAAAHPQPVSQGMLRSDAIGSADFHTSAGSAASAPSQESESPSPQGEMASLRVRNATPEKLTSLNSQRFAEAPVSASAGVPLPAAQIFAAPQTPPASLRTAVPQSNTVSHPERGERLKNFYSGTRSMPVVAAPKKELRQQAVSITGKKAHTIFFALGGISLLSLIGVALFLFLPKAEVHVTPYRIIQASDIELTGRAAASGSDEKTIAVRIVEKDKEVALTVPTTGTSGGVNQKAHGTVIIYNNYSTDPQPLVATTRLEAADGKLFRLTAGVTVPGMTNKDGTKDPGVIEAEVIADQAGEEYDIDATTFRIPGFKGGPKYDAFSAKSTKAMTGGGSSGTSDVAVVAKVDLDTAEREAKAKAKEEFLNEVRSELSPDEKILDEQMDIAALVPATVPEIGMVASAFEYKNTFKLRVFVFSEKIVREKIESMSEKNLQGIRFKPISSSITYSESVANFSEGMLRLRAQALVTMESDIDRDALKRDLLGQNEDDIKQVLDRFPEVKKIAVTFRPQWFVKSIPDDEDRVIILIEPGETGE